MENITRTRMKIFAITITALALCSICPAKADTAPDPNFAKDAVIVFAINDKIVLEIETDAFEKALAEAIEKKPRFIILEIDTPGGRTDLTHRICTALTQPHDCQIIAFIKGGSYGGAISAGAAVALACDKMYMANNTIIGAATAITISRDGPKDLKEAYGSTVGEKFNSAWRAYLASLAEQNNRPGLLARAMVDKDIEAVEVSEAGKKSIIDPINKNPNQRIIYTWSKKDSLLTLTAKEAVKSGIADKLVDTQADLLASLNASDARVIVDTELPKAKTEFKRAKGKFNRVSKKMDLKIKQLQQTRRRPKSLKLLREIRAGFKSLISLAKRYPDLHLDVQQLEAYFNSVEADYQSVKSGGR